MLSDQPADALMTPHSARDLFPVSTPSAATSIFMQEPHKSAIGTTLFTPSHLGRPTFAPAR